MNDLHAKEKLPAGYVRSEKMDLIKNKKQMIFVNALAAVLAVALILLGIAIQPEGASAALIIKQNPLAFALKCLVASVGCFAYIVAHEAVHGIFMWHYSRIKPRFGVAFTYAYAGSDCFFARTPYLVIALAPAATWFVAFGAITALVPADWFWVVWFLQIMNISGAAGDFYVFARILRMPQTVLVQDTGTAMTVYLPQNA